MPYILSSHETAFLPSHILWQSGIRRSVCFLRNFPVGRFPHSAHSSSLLFLLIGGLLMKNARHCSLRNPGFGRILELGPTVCDGWFVNRVRWFRTRSGIIIRFLTRITFGFSESRLLFSLRLASTLHCLFWRSGEFSIACLRLPAGSPSTPTFLFSFDSPCFSFSLFSHCWHSF